MTDHDDPTIEQVIGANITRLRGDQSQAALGAKLGELLGKPWSRQVVWQAEKGGRAFAASDLIALTVALGVPMSELFRTRAERVALPGGKLVATALAMLFDGDQGDLVRQDRLERLLTAVRRTNSDVMGAAHTQKVLIDAMENALEGVPSDPESLGFREALLALNDLTLDERNDSQ